MKTCFYSIAVSILCVAALTAQGGAQRGMVVRGEITSNSPIAGNLSVEIDGMGSGPLQSAMVQGDGSFEFERTVSRLEEMRSEDYLSTGHGA